MQIVNFAPQGSDANPEELRNLLKWAGCNLPEDYVAFLDATNGGDTSGDLPEYYRLWSTGDVVSQNEGYEVQRVLPDFIAIGDDGGPSMFLMKRNSWEIYRYPSSLNSCYAHRIALSFSELVKHIEGLRADA